MKQTILDHLSKLCPYRDALELRDTKTSGVTVFLYGVKVMQFQIVSKKPTLAFVESAIESPDSVGVPYKRLKLGSGLVRFDVASVADLQRLDDLILSVFLQCREQAPFETFGCCSSFTACSDAKQCVHLNDPEYWGCQYRRNLENGLIFYGKNVAQS